MDGYFSLEDKIQATGGNPAVMLRNNPGVRHPFPYPPEWTSWHTEQYAWKNGCVLFDQGEHMSDIYFSGPDVRRLFSDTALNDMSTFTRNDAKQFVACAPDGRFIGDAVLFGMEDDSWSLVGAPIAANWVHYQAIAGGYDVEVTLDHASPYNPAPRKLWRYQLNGPLTHDVIEAVAGRQIETPKFFGVVEFEIDGTPVRALNHTMSGVPGDRLTGLELYGPREHADRVMMALMQAGEPLGLQRGGALAYVSSGHESGWWAAPIPAIFSQPELKAYREWLPGFATEASLVVDGSFESLNVEDYYLDPWELGYGRLINWNHDFIGKQALEERRDAPHKKKVWLVWNDDDFIRLMRDGLFGGDDSRTRIVSPSSLYTPSQHYDTVLRGDRFVGFSNFGGYTVNMGRVVSIATIEEADAVDGAEVEIVWGEPDGGRGRRFMEPHHVQTRVRATVATRSPAKVPVQA
ncbi:aminomethyl transferase family protein [Microbacterium sp. NPDC058062]|uniref:aminomethyl transferase family protein n=1 Tax=Microbacterium sp. NPDC058062 TaxID=3346320 RepID=UPI0036D814AF